MREFLQEYGSQLVSKTIEHFQISIIALLLAIVIAVPLGILLSKTKNSKYRINDCRVLQTIPTLAILALMIPILVWVKRLPLWHYSYMYYYLY